VRILKGRPMDFPAVDRIATWETARNRLKPGDPTMGSTSNKVSGKVNELTGKAKQAVGYATDNRGMQAKGAAHEAKAIPRRQKAKLKKQ
jgi:uncharacterized protein YjbJ (UPF0337 family)